ncbi:MAG: metallophosphoesterase [Firmicutes bacterium]|nr:metallophosphoesterase [Bacillota bacterium]
MIKIFVTGDNHIGLKFNRFSEVSDKLIESRYESIKGMVRKAEEEECDIFVITGDLFDRINMTEKEVKRVVDILAEFNNDVLVLPGNHDYYTGEEKVWKYFENAISKCENNIKFITDMKEYTIDTGSEAAVIYPALCQSKHSTDNNLGWIKDANIDKSKFNIGIAHGTIEGVSPDMKNEYFCMGKNELYNIPVDVWLIGHAHIPYPELPVDKCETGHKIFNPGSHEQTDYSNNTEGCTFIICLDRKDGEKKVSARKVITGNVRFYDIPVTVEHEKGLKDSIENVIKNIPNKENSIIRLTLSGTAVADEYYERNDIYDAELSEFMTYEIEDKELSELITKDKIRAEFPEISFAAQLLEALDDPKELQMAYELVKACRE